MKALRWWTIPMIALMIGALFGLDLGRAVATTQAAAGTTNAESAGVSAQEAVQGGTTAVIRVDHTIETGLQRFLERSLREAETLGADTAILKVNTFGGRVDAAVGIGELIRNTPLHTVAYIEGKAISAGSYIALNAEDIYMQQGASIGAAAVVDLSGEHVTDTKVVSMWVAQMRSAAEAGGRNPKIAEGMVDENIAFELADVNFKKEKGSLITLTSEEALQVGYAEGVVDSFNEVLKAIGSERIIEIEPTLAEQLARVLTHPVTTTLLFVLGIGGLLIELLVPGFGIPGIVGITAFALYFLGNFVAGFAGVEHMVMFIAGVVLLLLELFIPSFGILGILGIIALISGVILAAYDTGNTLTALGIAVLIAGVIVAIFVKYFKHRGIWNRFILRDALKTEEGYVSHASRDELLGRIGKAATPLRPSGSMLLDGDRIDVVTNGEFIPVGASVEVVKVEGVRIVVKEASPVEDNGNAFQ